MFPIVRQAVLLAMFLLSTAVRAAAPAPDDFAHRIVALRADAYLLPRTTLQALERLKAENGPLTPAQQGKLLEVEGATRSRLHAPAEGLRIAAQLETLGRAQHDDALLALALLHRAYILSKSIHDAPTARQLIVKAAAIASTTRDPYLRVQALVSLGLVYAEDGDPAAGLPLIDQALELARAADDRDARIMALRAQASTRADLGRFDDALASIDTLLALVKREGLPIQLARAHLTDNEIAARAGRAERARRALRAAVATLQAADARECLPRIMADLAKAERRAGDNARAARLSATAQRLALADGGPDDVALTELEAGLDRIALRDIGPGRRMVQHALENFREDERYVQMLLDYAHALELAGDADGALKVYAQAGLRALAIWKKDKEMARESVIAAAEYQRAQSENVSLNRENGAKERELGHERQLKRLWWALSLVSTAALASVGLLYRRVRVSNRSLQTLNATLYTQSTSDALTGLRNRAYFYERIAGGFGDTRAAAGAFFLVDIDRFKAINDAHCHTVGDLVLRAVARRLQSVLREVDVLIRWGGEEFLVFVPDVDPAGATALARRLLDAVAAAPVAAGDGLHDVTVSLGFSVWPLHCDDAPLGWERQVHLADLALYLSKSGGRRQGHGVCGPARLSARALATVEADLRGAAAAGLVRLARVRAGDDAAGLSAAGVPAVGASELAVAPAGAMPPDVPAPDPVPARPD